MAETQQASLPAVTDQLALTELWPCTTCHGTGKVLVDNPAMIMAQTKRCPTCQGAGTLEYDPDDLSVIPF